MTAIGDIRNGLATRLETIAGLHVFDTGEWPDQITPPAALIKPARANHQIAFGAAGDQRTEHAFEVHVLVSLKGGLVNAQRALDLYAANTGVSSIYQAIAGDRYLGALVNYTQIRGWRDYDTVEVRLGDEAQEFLGAVVDVEVDAP